MSADPNPVDAHRGALSLCHARDGRRFYFLWRAVKDCHRPSGCSRSARSLASGCSISPPSRSHRDAMEFFFAHHRAPSGALSNPQDRERSAARRAMIESWAQETRPEGPYPRSVAGSSRRLGGQAQRVSPHRQAYAENAVRYHAHAPIIICISLTPSAAADSIVPQARAQAIGSPTLHARGGGRTRTMAVVG